MPSMDLKGPCEMPDEPCAALRERLAGSCGPGFAPAQGDLLPLRPGGGRLRRPLKSLWTKWAEVRVVNRTWNVHESWGFLRLPGLDLLPSATDTVKVHRIRIT